MPEIELKQQRRLRRRSRGPLPDESALVNGLLIGLSAVAAGSLVVGAFALLDQKSSISYAYVAPSVPPALGGLMNRPVDEVPVDERFFREAREPRDFSPIVFSVTAPEKVKDTGKKDQPKGKGEGKDEGTRNPGTAPGTPGTVTPDVVPVVSAPVAEPQVQPPAPTGIAPSPHQVTQALAPAQETVVATVKDVAPTLAPVAQEVITQVNDLIDSVEDVLPPLGLLNLP